MLSEEKELWRAVLLQAMRDMSDTSLSARERRKARKWFYTQSLDFLTVCDFADVNPDKIRKKVLATMQAKK